MTQMHEDHTSLMTLPAPQKERLFLKRRPRSPGKILLAFCAVTICALLALTKWPHYAGTAICQECGIRRDAFAWESRLIPLTLYRFTKDSPTVVSRALRDPNPPPPHHHNWTPSTIPAPNTEETAEAAPHLLYTVESPRVGRFVEDLSRYANHETLMKWRRLLLDPRYSLVMDSSLHYLRFPDEGFSTGTAFRAWWQPAEYPLWNRLRELTEPD